MAYKYSLFNNIIEVEKGERILYNALSHAVMRLPETGLPIDPVNIESSSIPYLLKENFIVNKEKDEAEDFWNALEDELRSEKNFHLMLNPTLECNCRCWYCIENHPGKSLMSQETLSKIQNLIESVLPRVDSLTISFFGGEPFLQFEQIVKPLMIWASKVCHRAEKKLQFVFTTNSLLLEDSMVEWLGQFPNQHYQITLDGCREDHNKVRKYSGGDSYYRIIEAIRKITDKNIPVLLRLNLTHENIGRAMNVADDFANLPEKNRKHITLTCQQVWQDVANGSLEGKYYELQKRFLEIGIFPHLIGLDRIKESCYGDHLNSVLVNYNGDLYKCSALEYDGSEHIGNIHTDETQALLRSDFPVYFNERKKLKDCRTCRILPLCARGCYKKIMYYSSGCSYPTAALKDEKVMAVLEDLAMMTLRHCKEKGISLEGKIRT